MRGRRLRRLSEGAMNHIAAWLAGGLMALVLAASMILDGQPSELQATQDVAAEVAELTRGNK